MPHDWIVFRPTAWCGLVFGGCCTAFAFAALMRENGSDDAVVAWLLGMSAVAPTLLAIWTVFGRWPLVHRVPTAVVGNLAAGLLFLGGFHLVERGVPFWAFYILAGASLAQWLLIQVPLWGARVVFHWRIERRWGVWNQTSPPIDAGAPKSSMQASSIQASSVKDTSITDSSFKESPVPPVRESDGPPQGPTATEEWPQENAQREVQFGIRHLLLWTTATAVILGLLRLSAVLGDRADSGHLLEASLLFATLAVFHALLSLPLIPLCLGSGPWRSFRGLALLGYLPYAIVMTALEIQFDTLQSTPASFVVGWTNGSGAALTIVLLLIYRFGGYRLVKR